MPQFVRELVGTEERLRSILERNHPEYDAHLTSWEILLDAFEATGGFLDGTYLWPYPREEEADYVQRQRMARYHNHLEALVDIYVRFLFTQGVKRTSKSPEYDAWTQNVDGAGTTLTELMKRFACFGLVHGHAATLVDKTADAPVDQTKAGERAQVVASVFTATAITDWRFDKQGLAAVKLLEDAPVLTLAEEQPESDPKQYLLWDREGWARFDADGELISADTPGLGLVPLVPLRPKPRYVSRMLGRPLISNANILRALYNRTSEEDEVLRSQAFSVLTVEVGPGGNVAQARKDLGDVLGTAKALVVQGEIDYKTPDQSVPGTLRENISYLVQELYRSAHVRFRKDGIQAETAEAIRLQQAELNEALQGLGTACANAEKAIARAWFGWTTPTAERAEAAFKAADVQAEYPREFFLDALMTDIDAWAESIRLDLGPTMTRRIKKKAVRRIEPDMPQDVQQQIDQEIDKMPVVSQAEIQQREMAIEEQQAELDFETKLRKLDKGEPARDASEMPEAKDRRS